MKILFSIIASTLMMTNIFSQDITFNPRTVAIADTMGKELIFYIDVTNITTIPQTLYIVRTQNNLPADWSSSLCLDFCYPPSLDSVATTPDFGSNPLQPGETREISLHVYTSASSPGQGTVQLKAGTFRNPSQIVTVTFFAATYNPSSVEDKFSLNNFSLEQNYPNPFNPSTIISWNLPNSSWISIKLFNSLGQELDTIVEGYFENGKHSKLYIINSSLPSGVYYYQLRAGNNIATRKMILEK